MRILVLDEEFPYPLTAGKRIRTYGLMSRLAKSCQIDYLAFGDEDSDAAMALRKCGIRPLAVGVQLAKKSGLGFYWRLFANLFTRLPFSVENHYHREFADRLAALLAENEYDLVICEWTPYAHYIRALRHIPCVVCTHNVEHQIWQRLRDNEPNPLRRLYIAIQAAKWRRFEADVFEWIDGATAVSPDDAAMISAMNPALTVGVIENGVDLEVFQANGEGESPQDMVFVGSMDWRPNQDGVRYFVHEVLPLVRQSQPKATFTVVGRRPPGEFTAMAASDQIEVTGTVPDVIPYINAAKVFVVPLRVGGGSRLKILEAFALRRAVVSTTIGAEGLNINDNEHLVLADDAEEFARAIVDLGGDSERRRRLGQAGRRLVEEHYGWDALAGRLQTFLTATIGRRTQTDDPESASSSARREER